MLLSAEGSDVQLCLRQQVVSRRPAYGTVTYRLLNGIITQLKYTINQHKNSGVGLKCIAIPRMPEMKQCLQNDAVVCHRWLGCMIHQHPTCYICPSSLCNICCYVIASVINPNLQTMSANSSSF